MTTAPTVSSKNLFLKAFSVFSSKTIGIILGLTANVLICRSLGVAGQGQYFLIIVTASVLKSIGHLGLPTILTIYSGKKIAPVQTLNALACLSPFIFFLLAGILFIPFHLFVEDALSPYLWVILFLSSLLLFQENLMGILIGCHLIKFRNFYDILGPSLFLFVIFTGTLFFEKTLDNFLKATLLSNLMVSVTGIYLIIKKLNGICWNLDKKLLKEMSKFCLKICPGNWASMLRDRVNIYALMVFSGPSAVGLYSIAYLIVDKLQMIPNSFAVILTQSMAQASSSESQKIMKSTTWQLGILLCFLSLIIYLSSSYFIPLIWGQNFSQVILPLKIMLLSIPLYAISRLISLYITQHLFRPGLNSVITWLSLLISFPMIIWLNERYGITGTAWAFVVQTVCLFFGFSWVYLKTQKRLAFETSQATQKNISIQTPTYGQDQTVL